MATQIKTKKTFGGADITRFSPEPKDDSPTTQNIIISFEDALKLHLSLGQALAKLNGYDRATGSGKRSAVKLSVHRRTMRIVVDEIQLSRTK
jgi:hypothetical protein